MRRRFTLFGATALALMVLALGLAMSASAENDTLKTVHSVTARFQSVQQAEKAGYAPFYQCTENLTGNAGKVGTMGQHFVKGSLVDGEAIATEPEALVYEPTANGGYRLVALEWVIPAPGSKATDPRPTVLGLQMNWRPAGNRFGLPEFYELHYWLYKSNPNGTFDDWNPTVSCRGTGDGL